VGTLLAKTPQKRWTWVGGLKKGPSRAYQVEGGIGGSRRKSFPAKNIVCSEKEITKAGEFSRGRRWNITSGKGYYRIIRVSGRKPEGVRKNPK